MKSSLALFVSACVLASSALAQSYSIDWFTVDGGGGTSTGDVYSVSGSYLCWAYRRQGVTLDAEGKIGKWLY